MDWRKIVTDYVEILRPEDYNVDTIYLTLASQLSGKVNEKEAKEFIAKTIGVNYKITGGNKHPKIVSIVIIVAAVAILVAVIVTVVHVTKKNKEKKSNASA